jgi:hypothetical protein
LIPVTLAGSKLKRSGIRKGDTHAKNILQKFGKRLHPVPAREASDR